MRGAYLNRYPMRAVVKATDHEGVVSFVQHFRARWWELTLECGHQVERSARYTKGAAGGRGFAALHHPAPHDAMLPAPKRVRCTQCPRTEST